MKAAPVTRRPFTTLLVVLVTASAKPQGEEPATTKCSVAISIKDAPAPNPACPGTDVTYKIGADIVIPEETTECSYTHLKKVWIHDTVLKHRVSPTDAWTDLPSAPTFEGGDGPRENSVRFSGLALGYYRQFHKNRVIVSYEPKDEDCGDCDCGDCIAESEWIPVDFVVAGAIIGDVVRGAGLPNSLAPRGETFDVPVTLIPAGATATIIMSGGNGQAHVAPGQLTGSGTVTVTSGNGQTAGLDLKIGATLHGGMACGTFESNPFAVCARPENMRQTVGNDSGGGNLHFEYEWDSDSGVKADLNRVGVTEHVSYGQIAAPTLPLHWRVGVS